MKKNAWAEFKKKPEGDLQKELQSRKERLWTLKIDLAAGKIKNVREIKEMKKVIARTKGLLHKAV